MRSVSPRADAAHAGTAAFAQGRRGLVRLGRFGYGAKGVVYVVLGAMALQAAFEAGKKAPGTQGALREIADKPLGEFLLWLLAAGLIGHALWRLVQAVRDTERKGKDAKGLAIRTGYIISAAIHVSLAVAAASIARGRPTRANSEQSLTADLMAMPFGRWLVAAIGLIVLGVGISQLYQAYSARFRERLRTAEMTPKEQRWAIRSGRAGYAARGITFGVIGVFLINAARQFDPQEAKGLAGALQTLENQPHGQWLLAIVGLGLLGYGVFQFILARYRRMVV